jgi:tRNA pseudouridine38-40 synthase
MVSAIARPETRTAADARTTTRFALVLEYDGTAYCGYQLQAGRPTVQGEVEKALKALTGEAVRISAASRTDAGVHARGQVVSFRTSGTLPVEAYVHGLNHLLPCDIAVREAHPVATDFNPRRMATSREYTYSILNSPARSPLTARFAHRIAPLLDARAMDRAAQILVGVHDFASFASEIGGELEKSTLRNVSRANVSRNGAMVTLTIEANAFLRHQVRNTAGALVQVGAGRITARDLERLMELRQPGLAGPALPPCGLCLERVTYPASFEEMR